MNCTGPLMNLEPPANKIASFNDAFLETKTTPGFFTFPLTKTLKNLGQKFDLYLYCYSILQFGIDLSIYVFWLMR